MNLLKSFSLFFLTVVLCANVYAGGKDHPALSRYKGAKIAERDGKVAFRQVDYAPYVLGIAKEKKKKIRGFEHYFGKYIDLEGKLTRIQYKVNKSEGLFKVYRNYEKALKSAGYEILFETSEKKSSWPFWNEIVYHREKGINPVREGRFQVPFGRYGFRYIAAEGNYKGKNIYFAIIFTLSGDNILITQDVIEVKPMESGLVKAEKMNNHIEKNGFVSIYGIHFDTGKWKIKKSSEPTLKEIAQFLKKHKKKKFFIVGHTDNSGKLSSNMTLSEKRADEVMKTLIKNYGIKAGQLEARGVGPLAPVTSNSTDEGKKRNRRVDVVEQ